MLVSASLFLYLCFNQAFCVGNSCPIPTIDQRFVRLKNDIPHITHLGGHDIWSAHERRPFIEASLKRAYDAHPACKRLTHTIDQEHVRLTLHTPQGHVKSFIKTLLGNSPWASVQDIVWTRPEGQEPPTLEVYLYCPRITLTPSLQKELAQHVSAREAWHAELTCLTFTSPQAWSLKIGERWITPQHPHPEWTCESVTSHEVRLRHNASNHSRLFS